jgi:transcriptional regulator with XRE-family HTH domain
MAMELAKNLITICKKKNMSLASLAKKSGVKQPTLHGWSTGRSVQNLDDLRKVCTVLEVALYSMLYGVPDPYESSDPPLEKIFEGDITVTIHKISKGEGKKPEKKNNKNGHDV